MLHTRVLTMQVDNEFGVLTRITALIRREGWNIKSLSVAETLAPEISRLTLCVECLDSTLDNVLGRLKQLACVRAAAVCTSEGREMAVALLHEGTAAPECARDIGGGWHEFTGPPAAVGLWCAQVKALGALEVSRTGVIAMEERP